MKPALSDPQGLGEERLMRRIPMLHSTYYCYYLI
jgi:hypothetical protein